MKNMYNPNRSELLSLKKKAELRNLYENLESLADDLINQDRFREANDCYRYKETVMSHILTKTTLPYRFRFPKGVYH